MSAASDTCREISVLVPESCSAAAETPWTLVLDSSAAEATAAACACVSSAIELSPLDDEDSSSTAEPIVLTALPTSLSNESARRSISSRARASRSASAFSCSASRRSTSISV